MNWDFGKALCCVCGKQGWAWSGFYEVTFCRFYPSTTNRCYVAYVKEKE